MLIENEMAAQKKLQNGLEPTKRRSTKGKEAVLVASVPDWLRG